MTSAINTENTYLARMTPDGTGAIATLALVGPDAWDLLKGLFLPAGRSFATDAPVGEFWLGRLGDVEGGGKDEVVVTLKSKSPVPSFEIHCHGGRQVISMLEGAFAGRGVLLTDWKRIEMLHGTSPLQVTAMDEMGRAITTRTSQILLEQYHGALENAVESIMACLDAEEYPKAGGLLHELYQWTPLGRHLTTPWKVAIAGAPNVGKSSLINRLAGYERCVVSSTAGTTRDLVTTQIAVDGWPMELIDTAGIRDESELIEREGIGLAMAAASKADLCLWLVDASAEPVWPQEHISSICHVINKIDLPPSWNVNEAATAMRISAETGQGIDELLNHIAATLVPKVPPAGAAVPFTPALCEMIEKAHSLTLQQEWKAAKAVLQDIKSSQ